MTKGSLADGDAIHEIRAAAVDGVLDLDHVLPVLRDLEEQDRIGMEAVVVVGRPTRLPSASYSVNVAWNQPGTASGRYGISSRAAAAMTSACPLRA